MKASKLTMLAILLFLTIGFASAATLKPSTKYINIQTEFEELSVTLEKTSYVDLIAHCPDFANSSCPAWEIYNTTITQNSSHVTFNVWERGAFIGISLPRINVTRNLTQIKAMLENLRNITITSLDETSQGLLLEFTLPITGMQKIMQVSDAVILIEGLKNESNLKNAQRVQLHNITYNSEIIEMRTDVVALEVENFSNAQIKVPKEGVVNTIMKCSDWDFNLSNCVSWTPTTISFTQDDDFVYFNVTSFSAYGGVELTVLTIQSYPQVGDIWTTKVITKGTANLSIVGVEGTIFGEDLVFDSLRCEDTTIDVIEIDNGIMVENYTCDGTTYHNVQVITSGKHSQRITFGDIVGFSRNLANEMPEIITVEGKLTNSTDQNQNGTFNITFRLYDVATDGIPLWIETHEEVHVEDGIFSQRLGNETALTLDWNTQYYLELMMEGDQNMTPRINLSSTPYANSADRAFNLSCTDCIDETQIDTADEFVIEGILNMTSADISMHSNRVINLSDPVAPQDAATMAYVDAQSMGGSESAGWSNSSGYVYLTTYTDEVNLTSLYVNNSNSRVGIGTYNPQAELHVVGNLNVTKNITSSSYRIEDATDSIVISATGSKPIVLTTDRGTWT